MANRKRSNSSKNKTDKEQESAQPGNVERQPDQQQQEHKGHDLPKRPDQRPAIYGAPTIGNLESAPEAMDTDLPPTSPGDEIDETWHRAGGDEPPPSGG